MGVSVSSFLRITGVAIEVRFGRYAVYNKTCFVGHYYTTSSIAAPETTKFAKIDIKASTGP